MTEGFPEKNNETILLDLAVECWRFQKLFARALAKMDASEAQRFISQHKFFVRRIEECLGSAGLRIVNLEGQVFDVGTAASALNAEDFDPHDTLVVDQMVEPIVMNDAGLLRTGTVMLRKVGQ